MTSIMIDMETLSTRKFPAILSVAAIRFDPKGNDRIDLGDDPIKAIKEHFSSRNLLFQLIDLDSCEENNMDFNETTLEWWASQQKDVIDFAFQDNNRITLEELMKKIYKFSNPCDSVWSHGSCFDVSIIEHVGEKIERPVPWKYWQVRDTRTLFELADPKMPEHNIKHHPLFDCYRQVVGVQEVIKTLTKNE